MHVTNASPHTSDGRQVLHCATKETTCQSASPKPSTCRRARSSKDTPVSGDLRKSRSLTHTPTFENNFVFWKSLPPSVMLAAKKRSKDLVSEFTMIAIATTMNLTDPAAPKSSLRQLVETTTIEETGTVRRSLVRADIMIKTASIDTATEKLAQSTVTKTEGIENATELQMLRGGSTSANTGTVHRRGDLPGRKRIREHAGSSILTPITTL